MKKSTPISRPLKYMYLFMVVVILFSMATMAVSAATNGNIADTRYYEEGPISVARTNFRYKSDDTSCYVYNDSSTCSISVMVYGNSTASWVGATNQSYYSYGLAVQPGEVRYIPNLVYENITSVYGSGYAALHVMPSDNSKDATVSFLWSPDSV